MSTDVIVILTFLALDFGAVFCGLMYLSERRAERDKTDVRRQQRRYKW
ncbi:MAG: hypothetical protein AB7P33_02425 [Dehalococcoidia bacterium]